MYNNMHVLTYMYINIYMNIYEHVWVSTPEILYKQSKLYSSNSESN